jgi:hypothetical protein
MLDQLQEPSEAAQLVAGGDDRAAAGRLAPRFEADFQGSIAFGDGAGRQLAGRGLQVAHHVLDQSRQPSERAGLGVAKVQRFMVRMCAHDNALVHLACPVRQIATGARIGR